MLSLVNYVTLTHKADIWPAYLSARIARPYLKSLIKKQVNFSL